MGTTLEDAADALYGEPPTAFVAARNARAASVRRDGDRALASAIAALPKPSAGAGAMNALVRDETTDAARLVDLGARFRDAEQRLDRDVVVELTRERKTLIAELIDRARQLADDAGHPLNAGAVKELEQTLRAGVADAGAGEAILSGRLVTGLRADGIDAVEVRNAVAAAVDAAPPRTPAARAPATAETDRAAAKARAEAQRTAEHEQAEARRAWKAAEARRAKAAERVEVAARSRSELDAEREQLEAELREVEDRQQEAEEDATRLDAELAAAESDERAARDATT